MDRIRYHSESHQLHIVTYLKQALLIILFALSCIECITIHLEGQENVQGTQGHSRRERLSAGRTLKLVPSRSVCRLIDWPELELTVFTPHRTFEEPLVHEE